MSSISDFSIIFMKKVQFQPLIIAITMVVFTMFGCVSDPKPTPPPTPPKSMVKVPAFDADLAFENVKKQVEFGPRVTNSVGHGACKTWLVETLEGYASNVIQQNFVATAYTRTDLNGTCLLYTSPSPRDQRGSRMPSSA